LSRRCEALRRRSHRDDGSKAAYATEPHVPDGLDEVREAVEVVLGAGVLRARFAVLPAASKIVHREPVDGIEYSVRGGALVGRCNPAAW